MERKTVIRLVVIAAVLVVVFVGLGMLRKGASAATAAASAPPSA